MIIIIIIIIIMIIKIIIMIIIMNRNPSRQRHLTYRLLGPYCKLRILVLLYESVIRNLRYGPRRQGK